MNDALHRRDHYDALIRRQRPAEDGCAAAVAGGNDWRCVEELRERCGGDPFNLPCRRGVWRRRRKDGRDEKLHNIRELGPKSCARDINNACDELRQCDRGGGAEANVLRVRRDRDGITQIANRWQLRSVDS